VSAQISVRSRATRVPIQLLGADGRHGNHWGVDIWFARGRLRVWNEGGIRVRTFVSGGSARPPFAPELRVAADFQDAPARYMQFVWDNIADYLTKGMPLSYRAEEAIHGMRLVDAVRRL
jgi:hypothetical protein